MKNTRLLTSLGFSIVIAAAQTPSQTPYRGQAWVGLLVSDSCEKGAQGSAKSADATREANLTVNSRVTTPAVDDSGTRGSSNASEPTGKAGSGKQNLPETGDILATRQSSTDPGWDKARKQARSLGAACAIDAAATRFALLLPDGSLLRFDELANQEIVKRLAATGKTSKFFRVSVEGKMQNGKIALTSIQL